MPDIIEDVEIFRTGTHTASSGDKAAWTVEDLDHIASGYDPGYHEAPVVVGHPESNGPAWGWVRTLKRVGDRLMATLELVPEFAELLRRGLYRKRSVSLYRDLDGRGPYLRHVGFLGAAPPAVKALADVAFSDGKGPLVFEFNAKEESMSWKDKVKSLFTQAVDEIPEPVPGAGDEAEGEAEKRRIDAEARAAERRRAVGARIEALVNRGVVIPAWTRNGLVRFAEALPDEESDLLEFAEGGDRMTPSAWFLAFLENLPESVPLGEAATRRNDPGEGDAARRLGELIRRKMNEEKGMGYALAFSEVQRENPDLAAEYVAEIRGR